jgi:hypothetical protein
MQTQIETAAAREESSAGGAGAVRATRRWDQVAAAAGVVFVATQLTVGGLLGDAPGPNARPSVIRDYLLAHDGKVLAAATLSAGGAFFFIWFLGSLREVLRSAESAEGEDASLSLVTFGAGIATIVLSTIASLPAAALSWNHTAVLADDGLVRVLWNLQSLTHTAIGGTAGIFTLAAAIVILRTRVLPAVVAFVALASSALGIISIFGIASNNPDAPPAFLGFAAFLLAMLFIALAGGCILVRLGRGDSPR